jgi:methylglutaconyl-CoA hydratase
MEGLELSRSSHTLLARIDRGEANAFSMEMLDALADAVERAASDPLLRFLRVRASGPVFCTGRDRPGGAPDAVRREGERIVRVNEALRSSPLVVVCEVQGDAAGFGAGLAAAADVTVAADHARFWFPELAAGLAPAVVLSWLGRLVPPKRAFELVARGRRLSAEEAVAIGIATETAPADEVVARADAWVAALEATDRRALAEVKSFLARCRHLSEPAAAWASVDALALSALRVQAEA